MSARPGGDARGSAESRRARKRWLLSPAAGFGGDGERVPCRWCGASLTYATLEIDRWPVEGRNGGAYIRANVVPACRRCNSAHSTLRLERRFRAVLAGLRARLARLGGAARGSPATRRT